LTSFNDTEFDFEPIEYPFGEILAPTSGQIFTPDSSILLSATYSDGDGENDDNVQWAVRYGTCAAGTGTVAGNVDGKNNPYDLWDGSSFEAAVDTAGWEEGMYCFVFNPTEDQGEKDVRETVEFYISRFTQ